MSRDRVPAYKIKKKDAHLFATFNEGEDGDEPVFHCWDTHGDVFTYRTDAEAKRDKWSSGLDEDFDIVEIRVPKTNDFRLVAQRTRESWKEGREYPTKDIASYALRRLREQDFYRAEWVS